MLFRSALVHQRFSTNTFPSWKLAHPYRFMAHNGEINTVRGNVNWMNARRRTMESDLLGPDLDKMWPLIPHGQSDTACLDNALELLVAGGYPLAHAMMMLIPEAWAGNPQMDKRMAFADAVAGGTSIKLDGYHTTGLPLTDIEQAYTPDFYERHSFRMAYDLANKIDTRMLDLSLECPHFINQQSKANSFMWAIL